MGRRWTGVGAAAGLFAAMVAFGIGSTWLATRPPSIALGVEPADAVFLFVATGLALAGAGCAALVAYPAEAFGRLTIAASLAWFAAGWTSPGDRHLAAVHGRAGARVRDRAPRGPRDPGVRDEPSRVRCGSLVAIGYVACIGLLGTRAGHHPGASTADCVACPTSLLGLVDAPAAGRMAPRRPGSRSPPPWAAAVAVVAGVPGRAASAAARRLIGPVVVPGVIAIAAFGLDAARSVPRGWIGVDEIDRVTWAVRAIALIVLAAGSGGADRPGQADQGRDRRDRPRPRPGDRGGSAAGQAPLRAFRPRPRARVPDRRRAPRRRHAARPRRRSMAPAGTRRRWSAMATSSRSSGTGQASSSTPTG